MGNAPLLFSVSFIVLIFFSASVASSSHLAKAADASGSEKAVPVATDKDRDRGLCRGTFYDVVQKVVNAETINPVNCTRTITLALIDTPDRSNKTGYAGARAITRSICPAGTNMTVDQDRGRRYDATGKINAVVYCNRTSLNAELFYAGYARIDTKYCVPSEFSGYDWAIKECLKANSTLKR